MAWQTYEMPLENFSYFMRNPSQSMKMRMKAEEVGMKIRMKMVWIIMKHCNEILRYENESSMKLEWNWQWNLYEMHLWYSPTTYEWSPAFKWMRDISNSNERPFIIMLEL